ncbi:alpha/beta fold hydrolase [Streptomyces mutabilis]|uniref:alpha/beta fold hydrolase n=1 Tax=Streptomyces TaxID=1883 RepID=UPI00368D2F3E
MILLLRATRLFRTDQGPKDAPVLLLVHGWGSDGREWSAHAEALAERFRVVVPDLRGHGRSPVPATGNTPPAMAHDLAALLEELHAAPVVAVGHSMGGQVVNLLAVHHPTAVRSVIALDPAHGAPEADLGDIRKNLAAYRDRGTQTAAEFVAGAFGPRTPPGLRTAHVRTMLGTPGHVIAQAYAGMYLDDAAVGLRPRSEEYLRLRSRPALTVWTAKAFAGWERTTVQVPESRVEHWPETGHYLHEERPDRTVRLIESWAAST